MSEPHFTHDIAIVGASLSGCAAAVTLARGGRRVALVEKGHPFRAKPCGEGLSASGVAAAKRLGFWSDFPAPVPSLPYEGFLLRAHDLERLLKLRRGGVSVERRVFDAHVMQVTATTPGVEVFFGAQATTRMLKEGIEVTSPGLDLAARYLVVADGSRSPVAQSLGVREVRTASPRVGAACHYRGRFHATPRFVHIEIERDFELYATPLAEGRLNIAVLTALGSSINPRKFLSSQARLQSLFAKLQFEGAQDSEVLGRAPIGGVERYGAPPGVLLVGDAAEEFDPIGGMGMTHALLSGELAGHVLLNEVARGAEGVLGMTRTYERRRAALARPFRRFTSLTYRMIRSSARWPVVLRVATSRLGEHVTDKLVP